MTTAMLQRGRKAPRDRVNGHKLKAQVLQLEIGAFQRICEGVNTPRALSCWLLAQYNEWQQYIDLPAVDQFSSTFADDYLVTSIMLKNPRLNLGVDLEQVAYDSFLASEELCRSTNRRFARFNDGFSTGDHDDDVFITSVQSVVRQVLGRVTPPMLDAIPEKFRFGPGATTSLSGLDVLLSKKYTCEQHVTPRLACFLRNLSPHVGGNPVLTGCSKLAFVPKSAKTHRTIAIEPHWNVYFQLGIGSELRGRLNKLGLDVDHQDRNRALAKSAYYRGLATVDLSAASDTVALEVVKCLLPQDWYHLLYIARTDNIRHGTHVIPLEKFSSMGNGYTWELESLIFYSIVRAVMGDDFDIDSVGIFGDDIILPQKFVPSLFKALQLFGFRVNEKKSFWQGRFFESCGADYYAGFDVRPFFFKKDEYHDLAEAATLMANAVRLYSHNACNRLGCDKRFLPAWFYLARKSREWGKTYSSYGSSDGGLFVNFDEATPSLLRWTKKFTGHEGYLGRVFYRKPARSTRTCPLGAYLAALNHGTPTLTRAEESSRGIVGRAQLRTVPINNWYDLGPWV